MPLKLQSDERRCLGVASAYRVSRQRVAREAALRFSGSATMAAPVCESGHCEVGTDAVHQNKGVMIGTMPSTPQASTR